MSSINKPVGEFEEKVAIVTGAASGIGKATVELLHERGARIVAVSRGANVETLAAPGIVPFVGDVTEEATSKGAIATAIREFGKPDIVVNNAGIIINKRVIDMTLDEWNNVLAVNATGAFLFSREAMKVMTPAKSGAIVNVGSYACFQAFPTIAAYAASKGALAQLTRALSLEAIGHGIRVNAVGSGDVATNILSASGDSEEALRQHGEKSPIRRAAEPREMAEVIAFLASPRASYMVGAVVMADGGMSVAVPG
ncbi:SDR family oxidoreductase [Paracoccus liaowanqingii]|uniref:SDR family oxidoreductase n=1 Tax=Paracoccus liaowanqingii TaxID=2560053 RepID=A0A4Z1BXA7_9RHOB|nr:SDR family oxidoreductase [Paracoccus liaowanqingii]TGN51940.1 SDR family oxidoreductase [Paracoccus liaowanqingii]